MFSHKNATTRNTWKKPSYLPKVGSIKRGLIMIQQLEQRLKELRTEFESGQKMMAELESKQANLRDTLLRISGAIQVLEELIATESNIIKEESEQTGQSSEKLVGQKKEMEIEAIE